jgi:hypothetical protein
MCSGSVCSEWAMLGRAVASTVLSICSINIALATMSANVRTLTVRRAGGSEQGGEAVIAASKRRADEALKHVPLALVQSLAGCF